MKSSHILLGLVCILGGFCTGVSCQKLRFSPKTEYKYVYKGGTRIPSVGLFNVTARVSIVPLEITAEGHTCRFIVRNYGFTVNHDGKADYEPAFPPERFDFSKWLSFSVTSEGMITQVYHPPEEEPIVLELKKILLGTLSAKLIFNDDKLNTQDRWAYRVNETGHEGEHESTYQAVPEHDKVVFTKTRHTKAVESADHQHVKIVEYHVKSQVPQSVFVREHFETKPDHAGQAEDEDQEYRIPVMGSYGEGTMKLEKITALNERSYLKLIEQPSNLTQGSTKVGEIPLPKLPVKTILADFKGNFSCVMRAEHGDLHLGIPCFTAMVALTRRISNDDLEALTLPYLYDKDPLTQEVIVDLLGDLATNKSWTMLVVHVLVVPDPDSHLVERALMKFNNNAKRIPKNVIEVLENVVFKDHYVFNDTEITKRVNDMATLVLGAVVDYMKPYDFSWSQNIAQQLENRLGVHDPWHHRNVRSVLSRDDLQEHLEIKSTHLLTLGNARMDSSFECIRSYLNTSDTHILLKTSAVDAIAEFNNEEVADILLDTAMNQEEDDNVRRSALRKYEKHPFGGDVTTVIAMMEGKIVNTTKISSEEHTRVRRGLKDAVARVWKGFEFKLQTPGITWDMGIGGKALGASSGLIVKNLLDIKIAPLKGHLVTDVHDAAWFTVHFGLLGFDFDIFRAELCFKGHIKYNINILKEFGFEDAKKFADIFTKHIPKVIKLIKNSVNNFNNLVDAFKDYSPAQIIDDLKDSLANLPRDTANLRRIGKRVWKAVSQFVDLPPIVEKVTDLVNHVTTLFNDIKTDVMRLYDSVVDMITVHIPWAWDEIRTAIKDIGKAFPKIIKNPKTSIQNIGKAVGRIAAAVGVLIDSKNEIIANNFFSKENRPYWFDIKGELSSIWEKVEAVWEEMGNIIDSLQDGGSANDLAKKFTGVELTTMKKQAMEEIIKIAMEEFEGPLNHIKALLEPFLLAVDFFKSTVANIKEAWTTLINAYKEARSLLEMIFGAKAHQDFPKKYLESESCGNGFWPTSGKSYSESGVMAEKSVGEQVVAPFNGFVSNASGNQIIIKVEQIKDVEIVINNVNPRDDIVGADIGAGDPIGSVASPRGCSDGHVHFALRKIGTKDYIDPSRYMEKRPPEKPEWVTECDRYLLVWKGKKLAGGTILGGPEESDETPDVPSAPPAGDLVLSDLGEKRKKRAFFDGIANFTKSLGIPEKMNKLKEIFSFKMSDITMKTVFDLMDEIGLSDTKEAILKVMKKIEDLTNMEMCTRPDSLDTSELRQRLILQGKSDAGARKTLINRFLETESRCFGLKNVLTKNVYCQFDATCTAMYCCLDLELFIYRHAITAFIRFDPCSYEITLGFNEWTKTYSILDDLLPLQGEFEMQLDVLKIAKLKTKFEIDKVGTNLKITIDLTLCSNREEDVCVDTVNFLKDAEIPISSCTDEPATAPEITRPSNAPTVNSLMELSITDVIKFIDASGLSEVEINEIVQQIREAFQAWLLDQIKNAIDKVFGNEFGLFDMCTKGYSHEFGPVKETFFEYSYLFFIGPIPMEFGMGLGGYYGASFKANICIMSMKATATVTPQVGSFVWGSLGIKLGPLKAQLRLTGFLLTVTLPTKAEIGFSKFPLDVKARMDIVLIPLRIQLHAELIFEIKFKIFGKKIHIRKVLISVLLWSYQSRAIRKNVFNLNDLEPDDTPPDFTMWSRATEKDDDDKESRKRRAIATTNRCMVKQIPGLDYTEPAFQIELGVDDDRSDVKMTYCVGTFRGGCDVINNESMGGSSVQISQSMTSGRKLFFTVTAANSMGLNAKATCELNTYDMTVPGGRMTPQYKATSNPHNLHALVLIVDDSPVKMNNIGVGKGRLHDDQVIPWHPLSDLERADKPPNTGHDPLGLRSLEHFANARVGALVWKPFHVASFTAPLACAQECLSYPALKCQSFNYDYGSSGRCELLENVESHQVKVHKKGQLHYFERLGVGHVSALHYENQQLIHNQMYYINNFLNNSLGYINILTGIGVLFDQTPPNPGYLENIKEDVWAHEPCTAFTPYIHQFRCEGETPLDNYRYIIDGPGSRSVFNGPKQLIDMMYTRSNTMVAGNWDGFHENETEILMYVWGVGTAHCIDNVHPHTDPHSHLHSSSDWTHMGIQHPVFMPDGLYHLTVRAINTIEHGGPMAVAVCHSTPYIIDTIPPEIHQIFNITYDEDEFEICAVINATDNVSGIKRVEFGLGSNPRNTYILDYFDLDNFTHPCVIYKVPNGRPVWIKARVTDRVDLRDVDHADKPIIVDTTPPIAGHVLDGSERSTDLFYQNSTTKYCGHWLDFVDPESGIYVYIVGLGTSPGDADVVDWEEMTGRTHEWCVSGVSLVHTTTYYLTVTAVNGGLKPRNVTVSSDGVYVDSTKPNPGWTKDGEDRNNDMMYSSDSATVSATFDGFNDPESDIDRLQTDIYRTHSGPGSKEELVHREEAMPADMTSLLMHHFHHHHGDVVRTEITATNGAESSVSVTTDGYTVDLTDPILSFLVDGTDPSLDRKYTSSMKTLSATWSFYDTESDISFYTLAVYRIFQGKRSQFYPEGDELKLPSTTTTWTYDQLALIKGVHYSIRVTAINGAGLGAVHDTTGVTVDPTPPQLLYVHAGVLTGASEEVIDGVVIHNDDSALVASWKGRDPESKVAEYFVGLGTSPEQTDVKGFASFGTKQDGVLSGLTLQEYSDDNPVLYYITVKVINGAGAESTIKSSSPIKIVAGDVPGLAYDGPDPDSDVDYQIDTGTLTITYSGFVSEAHGIAKVEACVGRKPSRDDLVPYTSQGIISQEDAGAETIGMGGQGKLQLLTPLEPGEKYHVTVRAHTGAGNILEASTDGVVPDTTPPVVNLTSVQGLEISDIQAGSPVYVRSLDPYAAEWNVAEEQSMLGGSSITIGTYPYGSDLLGYMDTSQITALPLGAVRISPTEGLPTILSLSANNNIGLKSSVIGPEFVADTSPPQDGVVSCPLYTSPQASSFGISCEWSGFLDAESSNGGFLVGLGYMEGDDSIVSFSRVEAGHARNVFRWNGSVTVDFEKPLIATVIAENLIGGQRAAYSQGIWVDQTPPTAGEIIDLPDTIVLNMSDASVHSPCGADLVCEERNAQCIRSMTQISLAWEAFYDEETPIVEYQIALGSTPGGTQIREFTSVPDGQLWVTVHGLDLTTTRQVFATVKGYNGAGLYSSSTSDGVYVSRASAGLSPLREPKVWDGPEKGNDLDFQEDSTALSASWDFSGDPCPVIKYELEIRRFDGKVALPMEEVPEGLMHGMVDGLRLRDGESYYAVVRATNALGHVVTHHSDGVTVKLEPLIPGTVRDGDVPGSDLNFWPHTDIISANWDGFGIDRVENMDVFENVDPDLDVEVGEHQTVDYYEVAVGTDRRYPNTRDNIHPFLNVGHNKTWTFHHLDLIPITATYYVTVRAYSLSQTMTQITSNGVKVGYGAKVINRGELSLPRYLGSLNVLAFSWSDFEFVVPVNSYSWALGTWNDEIENLKCTDLEGLTGKAPLPPLLSVIFDVMPPTEVGTDTAIEKKGLGLTQGGDYGVLVLAVDESGGCSHVTGQFTVDTTPPQEGSLTLGDGRHSTMAIWYTPSAETVELSWTGYADEESGLMDIRLGLYKAPSCTTPLNKHVPEVDPIVLEPDAMNYTYFNLELDRNAAYFVHLTVRNRASMETTTISKPILLDVKSPEAGAVKDGTEFTHDVNYQSSTNSIEGVLIYMPNPEMVACSPRNPLSKMQSIKSIHADDIRNIDDPEAAIDNVEIKNNKIDLSDGMLTLELKRDVKSPKMIGGVVQTEAHLLNGGTYEFEIQTASSTFHSVTSVAFLPETKKNSYSDFMENIFNETTGYGPERQERDYGKVVDQSTPGTDVNLDNPNLESQGFGFQIYSGVDSYMSSGHTMVVWAKRSNETWHYLVDLDFDPTSDFHMYKVSINEDGYIVGDNWHVSVAVQGKTYVSVYGVNPLGQPYEDIFTGRTVKAKDTVVQLGLYPRRGHLMPLPDVFNPPTTETIFRNLMFPPSSADLCRFGKPFQAGDQAIVEIMAGVGTERGLDDVEPLTKVYSPCIPCMHACDADVCDKACDKDLTQTVPLTLTGLNLPPRITDDTGDGNTTVTEPYYLTVVGRTASGREVRSSSNGIYVDPSPPEITKMYHLDLSWDQQEPILFQGNNHTIAIYWEADDIESEIEEFVWAIGSTPGATDIQAFESVGASSYAQNSSLLGLLEDETTYYVIVKAKNGAGQWGNKVSAGVTIVMTQPDVSDVGTEIEGSEALPNDTRGNAVKQDSQVHVIVGWEEPREEEHIEGLYLEMGTDEDNSDLFHQTQVGYNNSGKVDLSGDGLQMEGVDERFNLSDVRSRKKRASGGQMLLEPGRSITTHLNACNKGHRCDKIPIKDIIIARDQDNIESAQSGVLSSQVGGFHIQAPAVQPVGKTLVTGILSDDDLSLTYTTEASSTFRPYIVNPDNTINSTSRIMKDRIKGWQGDFVFLATLPGEPVEGGIELTTSFDPSLYPDKDMGGLEPRFLTWCAAEEIWVDVSRSCQPVSEDNIQIDWKNSILRVKVCNVHDACIEDLPVARRKRSSTVTYTGPSMLGLGNTSTTIPNSAPVVTSPPQFEMQEDEGKAVIRLEAEDADGDRFMFRLNDTINYPGSLTLSSSGLLQYTPPQNFAGNVSIYFMVIEIQVIVGIDPLITDSRIDIIVQEVNDNPEILFLSEGRDVIPSNFLLDLVMEQNHDNISRQHDVSILLVGYDVDPGDSIDIKVEPGIHGNLELTSQTTDVTLVTQDCSFPWAARMRTWETLVEDVKEKNTPVSLPVPCDLSLAAAASDVQWAIIHGVYTPEVQFHGVDVTKVIVEDRAGSRSELLQIRVHVQEFPCENNAQCQGPESDPKCINKERAYGFLEEGYTCVCPPDYTGVYCEYQIDDCSPDPCAFNFTCVDGIQNYTCTCENDTWPCAEEPSGLSTLQMILIGTLPALFVLTVIGIIVGICVRKHLKDKNKVYPKEDGSLIGASNGEYPTRALYNPDLQRQKAKQMQSYDNPVFSGTRFEMPRARVAYNPHHMPESSGNTISKLSDDDLVKSFKMRHRADNLYTADPGIFSPDDDGNHGDGRPSLHRGRLTPLPTASRGRVAPSGAHLTFSPSSSPDGRLPRTDADGLPSEDEIDLPRMEAWTPDYSDYDDVDERYGNSPSPLIPRAKSSRHPKPKAPVRIPQLPPVLPPLGGPRKPDGKLPPLGTMNAAFQDDIEEIDPVPSLPPWERAPLGGANRQARTGKLPSFRGRDLNDDTEEMLWGPETRTPTPTSGRPVVKAWKDTFKARLHGLSLFPSPMFRGKRGDKQDQ